MHAAEAARDEVLEMAGVLHDKTQPLLAHGYRYFTTAVAFAAALPDLDLERSRARDGKFPLRPIVRVSPEAEAVFVRSRFVTHHRAVRDGVSSGQRDVAGRLLNNRLTFRRRPQDYRFQIQGRRASQCLARDRDLKWLCLGQINASDG